MDLNRPQGNTQGEDHIDFEIGVASECVGITQPPFPTRMRIRYSPDHKSFASADRCNRLLDFLSFREHHFTICGAHVIQIDIDGEPRKSNTNRFSAVPPFKTIRSLRNG